jgi:diadenosine tetraphosphate (Ap4A) HIT family hydrolase
MTYNNNNVFAKILRGEIPNKTVYEDEHVLAFHDIAGAAPVHVLVIPKGEYASFHDFAQASAEVVATFFNRVRLVAEKLELPADGYRLITNHGYNGSQSVAHFHVHILGGKQLGGLLADDALVR